MEDDTGSLEDVSDVDQDDFVGFIGKQSDKGTAEYFEQMKVSKQKRLEYTEVTRRNRYRNRQRMTEEQVQEISLKLRAEKKGGTDKGQAGGL